MARPRKGWRLRPPRDGRPHYTVRFTDSAGQERELGTGTSDAVEAARVAQDLYVRCMSAAPVKGARIDPTLELDELMAQWLVDIASTHDELTVEWRAGQAKRFCAFFGKSLSNITTARMGDYQRLRLAQVLATTVRKERSGLNVFLDWCVEQGVLADEHRPKWPRLPKKAIGVRSGPQRAEPVDLTPAQVNALIAALPLWSRARKGQPAFAIRARYEVAYETGLRPATIDALEMPAHWRPGATEIVITDEIDKARYGRRVPISARCAAALERTIIALGLTSGPIFGAHDYRHAFERARLAAGLPEDVAPYDLRHARAGHLLDASGDIRAVAFLHGHTQLTTTNRYLRGQEGNARAAIDVMNIRDEAGTTEPSEEGGNRDEGNEPMKNGVRRRGLEPLRCYPLAPQSEGSDQDPGKTEGSGCQGDAASVSECQDNGAVPETGAADRASLGARFLDLLRGQIPPPDEGSESGTLDALQDWTDPMAPLRRVTIGGAS